LPKNFGRKLLWKARKICLKAAAGSGSVNGFNAGVRGRLPLSERVSINGGAGLYAWKIKSKFEVRDTTGFFFSNDSDSDDGVDAYYGAGLDIGWFGVFYEIYDIDGSDIDFAGVAAKFRLD
jgi:hypothetical protein